MALPLDREISVGGRRRARPPLLAFPSESVLALTREEGEGRGACRGGLAAPSLGQVIRPLVPGKAAVTAGPEHTHLPHGEGGDVRPSGGGHARGRGRTPGPGGNGNQAAGLVPQPGCPGRC